jgi:hypothetical protein
MHKCSGSTFGIGKQIFASSCFIIALLFASSSAYSDEQQYEEIEWTALMPADELVALLNPPGYIDEIVEGSRLDTLDMLHSGANEDPRTAPYLQALGSTNVIEEFDNKHIRIPGFIVPLETDEQQNITEFFIVPYFGACIHLPPPPPNQMLHVKTDQEVRLNDMQDAFWFEGKVIIETTNNRLGRAAYRLELNNIFAYEG